MRAYAFVCCLASYLGSGLVTGCRTLPDSKLRSAPQEAVSAVMDNDSAVEDMPYKLALAETIPHVARQVFMGESRADGSPSAESASKQLIFSFPSLSQEAFERLKQVYGGQSRVLWKADTEYTLQDFLPPMVQALFGKRIHFHRQEASELQIDGQKRPIFVDNQSIRWNFAYELMRKDPQAFSCFSVEGHVALQEGLENPDFSSILKDYRPRADLSEEDLASLNHGLRPGDFALIYADRKTPKAASVLQQVVIYIDRDIYLEKTGTDHILSLRLVHFQDLYAAFNSQIKARWVFRRAHEKAQLPDPRRIFSIAATKEPLALLQALDDAKAEELIFERGGDEGDIFFSRIVRIPLALDPDTGRTILAPEAYRKKSFEIRDLKRVRRPPA